MLGRHLLGIEGMSCEQIEFLLDSATEFVEVNERSVKKVPALRGKTVLNVFYEPSTRTRVSFEIAAKRLSADAVNISAKASSIEKGESLIDTAATLEAMNPDVIVVRHPSSGAPHAFAKCMSRAAVVNAGDGLHEHPTQALLDALTIRQSLGTLRGLKIALVGDCLRARVARSNIFLHKLFGNEVRIIAPPTLALKDFETLGVEICHDMAEGVNGADVVMSLRMKHEYLSDYFVPNLDEYAKKYCVNERVLSKHAPDSIYLAPGPIIRGIEVDSEVADGPRSRVLKQVSNGVAIRMSVLYLLSEQVARERSSSPSEVAEVSEVVVEKEEKIANA